MRVRKPPLGVCGPGGEELVEEEAGVPNSLFRRRRSLPGAVMRSADVKVSLAGVRACRTADLQ